MKPIRLLTRLAICWLALVSVSTAAEGPLLAYQASSNEQALRYIAKQSPLYFFIEGRCNYCHHFAPTLKQFAGRYGFRIVPLTLDGGTLPDFPQARRVDEQALGFAVPVVPAVFVFNSQRGGWVSVVYGVTSEEQLARAVMRAFQR